MDENFATRRKLYGDETLGRKNLQMVDICQKYGAHCKFPGNFKLDFPILIVFFWSHYSSGTFITSSCC